jgi:sulfoxide reductase heme-binding subunit YedZ
MGALSLDLVAALIVSSLLRRRVGLRAWRAIHWLAYLSWPVAFAHSLGTGSDVGTLWLQLVAGACALAIGLAVAWRVALRRPGKHLEPRRVPRPELARAAVHRRERTAA